MAERRRGKERKERGEEGEEREKGKKGSKKQIDKIENQNQQYDWLVREKVADGALIAKWRKPGYEFLCSLLAIQRSGTNFGTTALCRVPLRQRTEQQRVNPSAQTGCVSCASCDAGRHDGPIWWDQLDDSDEDEDGGGAGARGREGAGRQEEPAAEREEPAAERSKGTEEPAAKRARPSDAAAGDGEEQDDEEEDEDEEELDEEVQKRLQALKQGGGG